VWRVQDDDRSRVEYVFGGWFNGTVKEWWKLTTMDGTQYFFGFGLRYLGETGGLDTDSTQLVPVHGDDPGDLCCNASAGHGGSYCRLGYRWNLDHVVDPRGNSMMTYFYDKMQAGYGHNNNVNVEVYNVSALILKVAGHRGHGVGAQDRAEVPTWKAGPEPLFRSSRLSPKSIL
jgi:hypothetical protein